MGNPTKWRRNIAGKSLLTVEQREAYEEAIRRGIIIPPPEQLTKKLPGYRKLARPKQLPPDAKNFLPKLLETGDYRHVNVCLAPGSASKPPVMVNITEADEGYLDFFMWFILCGRGFGKTWVGANWINEGAKLATGEYMAVMGRDAHDVRAYCVEGESGILATAPNHFYPKYESSKRLIEWPNGVKCQLFYAEEPDAVRGPNCFRGWCDEPASYKDAHLGIKNADGKATAMSNFLMTLRKGKPQLLVTGTPKPHKLIKDLLNWKGAVIVRGSMFENKDNLSDVFLNTMRDQFEGTRVGRQELDGEVLDDNPHALWQRSWIERDRVPTYPALEMVVVGVDPMAVKNDDATDGRKTGIVAAGRWYHPGEARYHFYVLKDASIDGTPETWANCAVAQYKLFMADRIVAENNNGGDMVKSTIQNSDGDVSIGMVWASKGKYTRAEPVSRLSEQGRIHFVGSDFAELEDQLCTWQTGMPSPNNLDAFVWAVTALMDNTQGGEDPDAHKDFWNPLGEEDVTEYGGF